MSFNWSDEQDETNNSEADVAANNAINEALKQLAEASQPETKSQPQIPQVRLKTVRERAIEQMEQANLYRVLLEGNIFAPGSARAEILNRVESEIKFFIEERLVDLLNIDSGTKKLGLLGLSEKETIALKMLASKVAEKMPDSVVQKKIAKEEKTKTNKPILPRPSLNRVTISEEQASLAPQPTQQTYTPQMTPQQLIATGAAQTPPPVLSKPISQMTPEEAREEMKRRTNSGPPKSSNKRKSNRLPPATLEQQELLAARDAALTSKGTYANKFLVNKGNQ